MDIGTEAVRRLMEIGYMAAGGGMTAQADVIFAGVQAARPDSELPLIGRAVARLNSGRADDAITLLRQALERNPDSDLAAAFLGLALSQAGLRSAADALLQQVRAANRDPQAAALAGSLLEPG